MKKLCITIGASMMFVLAAVGPASADASGNGSGYGTQPGFEVASSNTPCAGHGSFGAFGKDHNQAGGTDGTQTGINNSSLCGQRFAQ